MPDPRSPSAPSPRPRRTRAAGSAVALVLLAAACGSGGSSTGLLPPAGIGAVILSLPPGVAPPGAHAAAVVVVDPATGAPLPGAAVLVNGVSLPYVAADQAYEGAVAIGPGDPVAVSVTVSGRSYAATAQQIAAAPAVVEPPPGAAWASGCPASLSWSGGSPAPGDVAFLLAFDPLRPDAAPVLDLDGLPAGGGSVALGAGALPPGDLTLLAGLRRELPFPGAAPGSALLVAVASARPLHVADAAYRELVLRPGNRGLAPGEALPFSATGPACILGGRDLDLTAAATWSSSDPGVATVGAGTGVVTGVAAGTATLSAAVDGIGGTTAVGVRSFTRRDAPAGFHYLQGVALGPPGVVVVGEGGTILTSPDGVDWTARTSGTGNQLTGVTAAPTRLVAVEFGTSATLASADGVLWEPGPAVGGGEGLWAVAWTGAELVAVGVGGGLHTSPDGLTWTARATGTGSALMAVAAGGGVRVAVGGGGLAAGGLALTSADGVAWALHEAPPVTVGFRGVAWDGRQFVAVGDGAPATSPDGATWTARPSPGIPPLPTLLMAVASSGTEVLAGGESGLVAASPDGERWISWALPGGPRITGIAWTGSRYVLVGAGGAVFTSP